MQMTFRKCTPAYSAPEVYLNDEYEAMDGKYTEKCDVFSAGYILYEMLTSEQLNKAVSTHEGLRKMLKISKLKGGFSLEHPALTPRWVDLLKRMLSFHPNERPSFAEIQQTVRGFEGGSQEVSVLRPMQPEETTRSRKVA